MPFIEMPLGDVRESAPVPEGRYNLVVVKAVEEASKAKREAEGDDAEPNMLHVVMAVRSDDFPNAAPVSAWFMYPDGGDYDELRMRELKRFLYWFNVPMDDNGFNTDDVEGCEGADIPLIQETTDNGRVLNSLALDPMPDDAEGTGEVSEEVAEEVEEEVAEEEPAEETVEEEQAEEEAPAPRKPAARAPARPAAKPAAKPAPKKPAPKAPAKPAAKKPAGRR